MKWSLEKTGGTLSLSETRNRRDNSKTEKTAAVIYYSGALFTLELEHFITIQSLTNFSFVKRPEGVAWSEYLYRIEELCAVEIEERAGFSIPAAYNSQILPFIGYSYLKLDYKPEYTVIASTAGHNVYHTFIMGLEYTLRINRQFSTEAFVLSSIPLSSYPLSNTKSRYMGYGGSFIFNFQYFGLRSFFSFKKNIETDNTYSSYITDFHEVGFTFRILD